MIKGLYAAASSMLANASRQKILAHNVSNLDTPGFKQIVTSMGDFVKTSVVFPGTRQPTPSMMAYVGELGLGVDGIIETTDFGAGIVRTTENELDLAIEGPGFFALQTPQGIRYTRDGRFIKDLAGNMVSVDGFRLLDLNGKPIKLPEGRVVISSNGEISVNNAVVGRIGLSEFKNVETDLARESGNIFSAVNAPVASKSSIIQQGALEMPNIDPAQIATSMSIIARTYEAAQKMVQNQDELLGKTINTLGRI